MQSGGWAADQTVMAAPAGIPVTVEVVSHTAAPLAPVVESPLPRTGSEMLFMVAVGIALVVLGVVLTRLTTHFQEQIDHA